MLNKSVSSGTRFTEHNRTKSSSVQLLSIIWSHRMEDKPCNSFPNQHRDHAQTRLAHIFRHPSSFVMKTPDYSDDFYYFMQVICSHRYFCSLPYQLSLTIRTVYPIFYIFPLSPSVWTLINNTPHSTVELLIEQKCFYRCKSYRSCWKSERNNKDLTVDLPQLCILSSFL